ncbi:hypothetical protein PsorP6_002187 [Peronosclerospora sorghi]|uniref:Uncharacterized protein n=1 Tax=Peronosclerospora sorghi TaxID=230839 RepID=A0ACC0WSP0_9STRA|nr:hypothetical protein PsorP6_002187 [Peronosclerospora sorghi]
MKSVKNFQSLIGSLLWISRCSRPDIAYAVHRATRRTHAPTNFDWKTAKRILRFLKGTSKLKLRMEMAKGTKTEEKFGIEVTGYSDADFGVSKIDRKSTSGGVILMN